jgi:hypothetical protein
LFYLIVTILMMQVLALSTLFFLVDRWKRRHNMKRFARIVLALIVIVWLALPSTGANAVSAVATSGSIHMDRTTPVLFDDVRISLQGSGFSLTNNFLVDSFQFTGTPNPASSAFSILSPGTMMDFTGHAALVAPNDLLVFNGLSYRASGTISVATSPTVVTSLVTEPFTLAGFIHGESLTGPETVDLSLSGSGLVTAQYIEFPVGFLIRSITYDVGAIPEPDTALLLGTGLAGLAGWRRMKRWCLADPPSQADAT